MISAIRIFAPMGRNAVTWDVHRAVFDLQTDHGENDAGREIGPYRIINTLGSGGMGVVYGAWDTRLERRVALKMIRSHLLSDPAVTKRFLQEARAAARVEHPNVVRVYRIEHIGDELAIEMEYVEGTPLSALLGGTPLDSYHVADFMRQVLTALVACHEQGIIHCDLKPGNLLVTADRHVYLSDFGIARAFEVSESADGETMTTRSGRFWGTPRYCPPEVWDNRSPDGRWDLYSLGVLAYEAFATMPAFDGSTPAVVMKQKLLSTPPPLGEIRPDLSPELAALVTALMARDPEDRPPSAADALMRLENVGEIQMSQAATESVAVTIRSPRRAKDAVHPTGTAKARSWRYGAGMLCVGLLIALGIGLSLIWGVPLAGHGKTPVAGISPLPHPEPRELRSTFQGVHFVYDDGVHGAELWYGNLQGEVMLAHDLLPGQRGSNPHGLHNTSDRRTILFTATTPETGEELWYARSLAQDGFDVQLIRDIIPGTMGSEPACFTEMEGLTLFYATTLAEGREIWMTNTREQQTGLLADIFPGISGSMHPGGAQPGHGGIYFYAHDGRGLGKVLFHYNHKTGDTNAIADAFDDRGHMAIAGDSLMVSRHDEAHGDELWVYDVTDAALSLLGDLNPGTPSSDPQQMFSWQGRVYFRAKTDATGAEVWVSDGTSSGTSLLLDIHPGKGDSDPYGFVDGGSYLFFKAKDEAHGTELWMTDGTSAGTRRVADVWPGPDSGDPYSIVATKDRVFFTARERTYGEELYMYRYADDAITRLTDLWPGPQGSEPYEFCLVGPTAGMFRCKLPDNRFAIGTVTWDVDPPVVSITELPYTP